MTVPTATTLRQFEEAFIRYLPPSPRFPTVNPSTDRINTGENEDLKPSTESTVDTSENAISPAKNAGGGRVDTSKPGIEAGECKKVEVEWEV
jgi:hypothetical protein